ncbi:hypothetical protein EDB83DRAFT_219135 [Lactarius deliciosus]|nr:hypothetical protein EDB83DRAFT_219135 [Lactarius deliciosus]
MKSTLILAAATSLLATAVHGSVIKVSSGATGSTQNPSGTASVSFSASYASSTPGSTPSASDASGTPSGIPSGTPSGISSGLPTSTPLASTFTPETTYTTVSA